MFFYDFSICISLRINLSKNDKGFRFQKFCAFYWKYFELVFDSCGVHRSLFRSIAWVWGQSCYEITRRHSEVTCRGQKGSLGLRHRDYLTPYMAVGYESVFQCPNRAKCYVDARKREWLTRDGRNITQLVYRQSNQYI